MSYTLSEITLSVKIKMKHTLEYYSTAVKWAKSLMALSQMNKAATKEAHWARTAGLVTTRGIANAFHC